MIWIGFFISLVTILLISKRNLAVALISGSIVLGVFTLPFELVIDRMIFTVTDSSIVLLALAMGLIPILGGIMTDNGLIDNLVSNLRISRKYLLASVAALMGLLPMPGGALLSAPILAKGGDGVPAELNAAINNWFRHLFLLIYPLGPALIASAKIVGLDVYHVILYLLPGAILAFILGYVFFLRHVKGAVRHSKMFSLSGLLVPMCVIVAAPVVDFTLKRSLSAGSLATVIGVSVSLILSLSLGRNNISIKSIIVRMKPWNFALIIIGMFLYLHIFQETDIGARISTIPLPPLILAVSTGFLLGLATGRVQLPASIIFPIYLASIASVTPVIFALIYIAIYFGYVISPVHPCLIVTCEYFKISVKDLMLKLAAPTAILFAVVLAISILISS
jgi:integral membrane protein (TIGR00529 family)